MMFVYCVMQSQTNCHMHLDSDFESRCLIPYEGMGYIDQSKDTFIACKGSIVTYTAYGDCPCDTVYQYYWDIIGADSFYVNGNNVVVEWGYGEWGYVHLTYMDYCQCQCDIEREVTLVSPPIARSKSIPDYFTDSTGQKIITICRGGNISFVDESEVLDGEIVGHTWHSYNVTTSDANYSIENVEDNTEVEHIVTNSCGCTDIERYLINVVEGEDLELSCYGTVCDGDVVTYEALTPVCDVFSWMVYGGHIVGPRNLPEVTVVWDDPYNGYGEIVLDGSMCDAGACSNMLSKKIPIVQNRVPIVGRTSVCVGDVASYTVPLWGSVNYTWVISPDSVGYLVIPNDANKAEILFDTPGIYQIWVTYGSDFLGCGQFMSRPLTVNVKPKLQIIGERKVCAANPCVLTTHDGSIVNWKVYSYADSLVFDTICATFSRTMPTVGIYRVVASSNQYCDKVETRINVVSAPPAPSGVGTSVEVCYNASVVLRGQADNNKYTLQWRPEDTTCARPMYATGSEVAISFSGGRLCPIDVYQYDRELRCRSDSAKVVHINPFSLEPTNLSRHTYVCPGISMVFEVPFQSNVMYQWKIQHDAQKYASVQGDAMANSIRLVVNEFDSLDSVSFDVYLERKFCSGGYQMDTVTLHVKRNHSRSITIVSTPQDTVCSGQMVDFAAIGADEKTYYWKSDEDRVGSSGYNYHYSFKNTGRHYVLLRYSPFDYCSNENYYAVKKDSIEVRQGPPAQAIVYDSVSNIVSIIPPLHPPEYSNRWYYNDASISSPNHYYVRFRGDGMYDCEVTDNRTGCSVLVHGTIYHNYSGSNGCNNERRVPWADSTMFDTCSGSIMLITDPILGDSPTWSSGGSDYSYEHNGNTTTIVFHRAGEFTIRASGNCNYSEINVNVDFVPILSASQVCGEIVIRNSSFHGSGVDSIVLSVGGERLTFGVDDQEFHFAPETAGRYYFELESVLCRHSYGYRIVCDTFSCEFVPRPHDSVLLAIGNIFDTNLTCDNTPIHLSVSLASGKKIVETEWQFGDGTYYKGAGSEIYHTYEVQYNVQQRYYDYSVICVDTEFCTYSSEINRIVSKPDVFANNNMWIMNSVEEICPYYEMDSLFVILDGSGPVSSRYYFWNDDTVYSINNYHLTNHSALIRVRSVDINMCKKQASLFVPFKNAPTAVIASDKWEYCFGEKVRLFGAPDEDTGSYEFRWTITSPQGEVFVDSTATISFRATDSGYYMIDLCVTNSEGCRGCQNGFMMRINPQPQAPDIGFEENACMDRPPVMVANISDDRPLHWSNGRLGTEATYYVAGSATAYYSDTLTGCRSDTLEIFIPAAPNFDAIPTGCYKVCPEYIPTDIHCSGLSPLGRTMNWWWNGDGGEYSGTSNSIDLHVEQFGRYNLTVDYGNGCNVSSSDFVVEESPECKCKGLMVEYTYKYYYEGCKYYYDIELTICNETETAYCIDQIDMISQMPYVDYVFQTLIPSSISPNDCATVVINVETLPVQQLVLPFRISSNTCHGCYKDFALTLKPEEPCNVYFDFEITSIELEESFVRFVFSADFHTVVGYGEENELLSDTPMAVDETEWYAAPSMVFNTSFDGQNTIDGEVLINLDELADWILQGGDVCFYACNDNWGCALFFCVPTEDLMELIGVGAVSHFVKPRNQFEYERVVNVYPNPTMGEINVKDNNASIVSIELLDIYGRCRKKWFANEDMYINEVETGVYMVKIVFDDGQSKYYKILKK